MELLPTVIFTAIEVAAVAGLAVLALWRARDKPIDQATPDDRPRRPGRRSTW